VQVVKPQQHGDRAPQSSFLIAFETVSILVANPQEKTQ
jgi:hypothetical protein